MPQIRHITWGVRELDIDPANYDFESDKDILHKVKETINTSPEYGQNNNHLSLIPPTDKKFTRDQLKQLLVARSFLPLICEWLEPGQIEDTRNRARVAIVQQLLTEIWEDLVT